MHDLRLVGVHDDGEHLVLAGADGEKFRLRVDEPLRAAVRRDRPRLGQLQMQLEGGLRPREIQARIRMGESAESIAAAANVPIEHIRRYEGPVLAEREFIARQARNVRMRGISRVDGTVPTLGELVSERLTAREADTTEDSWDAWRGDDGIWIVGLTFIAGNRERRALWTYDAALRHVNPRDDEARWLSEQQREGPSPGAAINRRLMSVRGGRDGATEYVFDIEADDDRQLVDTGVATKVEPEQEPDDEQASTVNLLESLRERRGRRQRMPSLEELDEDELFERAPAQPRHTTPSHEDHPSASIKATPSRSRSGGADAHVVELSGDRLDSLLSPPRTSIHDAPEEIDDAPLASPAPVQSTPTPLSPAQRSAASTTSARDVRSLSTEHVAPKPHGPTPKGSPALAAPNGSTPPAASPGEPEPTPPPTKRGKRTSVPTWDDIVFGGRRE